MEITVVINDGEYDHDIDIECQKFKSLTSNIVKADDVTIRLPGSIVGIYTDVPASLTAEGEITTFIKD